MAVLELDIVSRLRAFALELTLDVGDEVVAIAGPSGAGKTTALRCVAGLHRPERGRIACAGDVWFDGAAANAAPEHRSVGYVPQEHALFPHLSVAGNVAFSGADDAAVSALLARLRIGHLAGVRPAQLSGGERQRTALARALARRPRVLLLDEPLAALDAQTRRLVRDELAAELRDLGIPTLLVTHDFTDAAALAGRVAILVDGTVRQLGTPAELTAAPADGFVVAFTGGSVVRWDSPDGEVSAGLYPWDVEVRPGPGPPGTLAGTVTSTAIEGGRIRVRVGDWVGESTAVEGLAPGAPAHGVVRRAHVMAAIDSAR